MNGTYALKNLVDIRFDANYGEDDGEDGEGEEGDDDDDDGGDGDGDEEGDEDGDSKVEPPRPPVQRGAKTADASTGEGTLPRPALNRQVAAKDSPPAKQVQSPSLASKLGESKATARRTAPPAVQPTVAGRRAPRLTKPPEPEASTRSNAEGAPRRPPPRDPRDVRTKTPLSFIPGTPSHMDTRYEHGWKNSADVPRPQPTHKVPRPLPAATAKGFRARLLPAERTEEEAVPVGIAKASEEEVQLYGGAAGDEPGGAWWTGAESVAPRGDVPRETNAYPADASPRCGERSSVMLPEGGSEEGQLRQLEPFDNLAGGLPSLTGATSHAPLPSWRPSHALSSHVAGGHGGSKGQSKVATSSSPTLSTTKGSPTRGGSPTKSSATSPTKGAAGGSPYQGDSSASSPSLLGGEAGRSRAARRIAEASSEASTSERHVRGDGTGSPARRADLVASDKSTGRSSCQPVNLPARRQPRELRHDIRRPKRLELADRLRRQSGGTSGLLPDDAKRALQRHGKLSGGSSFYTERVADLLHGGSACRCARPLDQVCGVTCKRRVGMEGQ